MGIVWGGSIVWGDSPHSSFWDLELKGLEDVTPWLVQAHISRVLSILPILYGGCSGRRASKTPANAPNSSGKMWLRIMSLAARVAHLDYHELLLQRDRDLVLGHHWPLLISFLLFEPTLSGLDHKLGHCV